MLRRHVAQTAPPSRPATAPAILEPLESRLLMATDLLITEFMASNESTLTDVDGAFSDWIELQNISGAPLNLNGWKLKDTSATWTFPSKTLVAGEIIVVFASDKNRTNPAAQLHTNFKLAKEGELLQLLRPNNAIEQQFNPYPEQFDDVSYGVSQDADTLLPVGAGLSYRVPTLADNGLGTTWTQPAFDDAAWATTVGSSASTILITEAATGVPDWFEIQNVSGQAVNTTGWIVATSENNSNINVVNGTPKALPAQLNAGQVKYFSDDAADTANYFGSNINWSTNGTGWVLLMNSAGAVVDFVAWGFSAAQVATFNVTINGRNITAASLPWSGAGAAAGGTNTNSIKRTGTSDSNTSSNFAFTGSPTKGNTNVGLTVPFPGSVVPATTGIGYSAGGAGSGFEVTYYKANIAVSTLALAEGVIATPGQQTSSATGRFDVVNFMNTVSTGRYGGDLALPGTTNGVDVDDYVTRSTTKVFIPRAGKWTFGVNSDDGFGMDITGNGASFHMEWPAVRGPTDSLAVFDAPVAGVYDLRLVHFDRTGGSGVELFAAEGELTTFSAAAFDLVGDTANGGLQVAGFAPDIKANVQAAMQNVNASLWTRIDFNVADPSLYDVLTLKMKYDAGFVAYLNGVKVAERRAPASPLWNSASSPATDRLTADAAFFESINITAFLSGLVAGNNVLAIHGLNSSAADADFIILPEISAGNTGGTLQYFSTPTPNATNAGGVLAFVKDTKFSHDRGFYSASFPLTITTSTAGASIRYTTNGSAPTPTTGTLYTGPVTIDKTTVIRAIAYKTGFEPTNIDTQTFFFVADILQQSAATAVAAGFPSGNVNGQVMDYGMDPDIVNSPVWGPQLAAALTDIPSMSIVTDNAHLFSASTGIYVNATEDSVVWERPTSLELIDPAGLEEGFQINAGIRIRGGFSRADGNPKHSFRFFFREEYGDSKLEYALFGDEGADEYDKIDLRTSQNYSWAFGGDPQNIMNRDVFFRDLQRDMEDPYTRSRYYHLYLNGQYWGLYQTQERSEAKYAATYFGGEPEDYDVVKVEAGPYTINATDGTLAAWQTLWNMGVAGFETNAKYYAAQGRNPDGTRNPALPVYLDVDSLASYMIGILYGGNLDAPISNFLGNTSPNNWYGVYNHTTQDSGFKFFAHDSEHTLLVSNVNTNRNGPFPAGDTFDKSNPQWLHQQLMFHPEYRVRFADLVQAAFFNDGVLTIENNVERFLDRAAEIESAIIAESARWGDSKVATPFTKDTWQTALNDLLTSWFPQRNDIVLSQLRTTTLRSGASAPLFPSINAPQFNVHGGIVGENFELTMTAAAGQIYYTLDGSDPRLPGGALNPSALPFNGSTSTTTLVAAGATWKYLDNGSDQGTAWRHPGFIDSSWLGGPAQLGYGDGDEATIVGFGPDETNKYVTTYFRRTFDIADASDLSSLSMRLMYDDGAAVYLNGQRLQINSNMADDVTYTTPALGLIAEGAFITYSLDPALLVDGTNTIAVEVHQNVGNSTDLSFDLELTAEVLTGDAVVLTSSGAVRTRARSGAEWSALNEAVFLVNTPPDATNLVITELHYHPPVASAAELAVDPMLNPDEFEYLEVMNVGPEALDLFGVHFTAGITFSFTDSDVTTLAPGERAIIVSNRAAFELRYGTGHNLAGEYEGQLADSGEQLTLVNSALGIIADITYGDSGDWPGRPDGDGSSLELDTPVVTPVNYGDPDRWRASSEYNGTPGAAGLGPDNRVVVNEVLSHTDLPLRDSIELYNTTASAINIGGWFISDAASNLAKFRIPTNTFIGPGAYLVFNETQFNPGGGAQPNDFSFNAAHGDDAYLVQADPSTQKLQRFVDDVSFGAQANGESWGRFPSGSGALTPMAQRSLGTANGTPRVGPVVISEVMYQPVDPGNLPVGMTAAALEFIEIHNPTGATVSLTDWRIRGGIDFDFAAGTTIGAGQTRVIISFDPADPLNADKLAAFRSYYGITASVPLIGPFIGDLSNGGETINLQRPDEPPADEPLFIPRLYEDEADYDNNAPWPTGAAGAGQSLHRVLPATHGSLSTSFTGAPPSPGSIAPTDAIAPRVTLVQLLGTGWNPAVINWLRDHGFGDGGAALNTGGNQLLPITWTNLNTLTVRFTEHVIVAQDHLALRGVNTTEAGIAGFSYDPATFTATWTFGAALGVDKWMVHLFDLVEDAAGNALDGEWTTGDSALPSGDGSAGGDFLFRFNVVPGDVNASGDVLGADVILVRNAQFRTTASANYDPKLDVNGSGSILGDDVVAVRNLQFTALPAGDPTPGTPPQGLLSLSQEPATTLALVSQPAESQPAASPAAPRLPSPLSALGALLWHLEQQQSAAAKPELKPAPRVALNRLAGLWTFDLGETAAKRGRLRA